MSSYNIKRFWRSKTKHNLDLKIINHFNNVIGTFCMWQKWQKELWETRRVQILTVILFSKNCKYISALAFITTTSRKTTSSSLGSYLRNTTRLWTLCSCFIKTATKQTTDNSTLFPLLMMPTRIFCLTIRSFLTWWSFPLFS